MDVITCRRHDLFTLVKGHPGSYAIAVIKINSKQQPRPKPECRPSDAESRTSLLLLKLETHPSVNPGFAVYIVVLVIKLTH